MANDSSIRGVVWFDTDNSGTRNGGEAGHGGIEVWLYDSAGTLVATQVTRGSHINGSPFAFEGLAAGTYEVRISGGSFAGSYDVDGFDTPHRAIVTLTDRKRLRMSTLAFGISLTGSRSRTPRPMRIGRPRRAWCSRRNIQWMPAR